MDFNNLLSITSLSGYAAFILLFVSYQANDRKRILGLLVLAMICLTAHQFFLGALAGAVANGLTIIRNILFRYKETTKILQHYAWPYIFSTILIGSSLFLWQGWYSILPALAVIASTCALWANRPKTIRVLSLIGPLLWLPYGFIIESTPTVLIQITIISSVLIAIARFDTKLLHKDS